MFFFFSKDCKKFWKALRINKIEVYAFDLKKNIPISELRVVYKIPKQKQLVSEFLFVGLYNVRNRLLKDYISINKTLTDSRRYIEHHTAQNVTGYTISIGY